MIARFGYCPSTWARFSIRLADGGGSTASTATDDAVPRSEWSVEWRRRARLPDAFFIDWVRVAVEEAKHFTRWRLRLEALGSGYGAFTAHTGQAMAPNGERLLHACCPVSACHHMREHLLGKFVGLSIDGQLFVVSGHPNMERSCET